MKICKDHLQTNAYRQTDRETDRRREGETFANPKLLSELKTAQHSIFFLRQGTLEAMDLVVEVGID